VPQISAEDFAERLFYPWETLGKLLARVCDCGGRAVVEFVFGEHHLDVDRRELRRSAELIAVEPQVFDLLVYLVRNREHVVSKDDLIASVWRGRIVSESTIASHIHAARRAVGDNGAAQHLIRTVPRKGIRFIGSVRECKYSGPGIISAIVQDGFPRPRLALPDKPSIAVLPFANLSSDPDQDYFADGMVEEIITALSRYPSLFVIARGSSFAYKHHAVDVRQVGHQLGVRYILEGSLRKSGHRIRVAAQLAESETGKQLWAERYDRELTDIFAVQDNITEATTTAVAPAIAAAERHRAMRMPPENLDAWATYQRGLWHFYKFTPGDNVLAHSYFQQAIDIDPNFGAGYKGLAWTHIHTAGVLGTRTPAEAYSSAEALARKAVARDPTDAEAHSTLSGTMLWSHGDYDGARTEAELALEISPNLAFGHAALAAALVYSGHTTEGLAALEVSMRLDPQYPMMPLRLTLMALGLYFAREYEAAAEAAKRAIRSNPDFPLAYRWLAASLGQLGQAAEAKEALEKAVALAPASFNMYVRRVPWHQPDDHAHMIAGLLKAGWKG
jgi:adenylate cyclase